MVDGQLASGLIDCVEDDVLFYRNPSVVNRQVITTPPTLLTA
jgi:hypothetical protein